MTIRNRMTFAFNNLHTETRLERERERGMRTSSNESSQHKVLADRKCADPPTLQSHISKAWADHALQKPTAAHMLAQEMF